MRKLIAITIAFGLMTIILVNHFFAPETTVKFVDKQAPDKKVEGAKIKEFTKNGKKIAKKIKSKSKARGGLFPEIVELKSKVIFTEEERKQLEAFYQSPENLMRAFVALSSMDFSNEKKAITERIEAVNFMVKILKSKNHSLHDQTLEKAAHFLNSERYRELKTKEQKKIVMGDKLEIAMILMQHHREDYLKIKETIMTTKNAKLMKFAENMYKSNKGPNYETL